MTELDFLNETPTASPPRRGLSLANIVLLAGVLVVALVFGLALARQNQTQPTNGPAPDFTLTTLDGGQMRLRDLKGKVVVINFWGSWCLPCRAEAPDLQSVWERYKDRDVILVGVAWNDTEQLAIDFIEEYGQTYPNGLDMGNKISDAYHIIGVPETFIIDRDGNVAEFIYANVTEAALSASIERVLNS